MLKAEKPFVLVQRVRAAVNPSYSKVSSLEGWSLF